jgi:hypothetical protein
VQFSELTPRVLKRLAWGAFALQVAAVVLWAIVVDRHDPQRSVSAEITGPAHLRFGRTEAERRHMYQELVRGEPADRAGSLHEAETTIWNRNHDSFFHQLEWRRIPAVWARLGIPLWLGYLVMDEGMREHWPPPPGVTVYADDTPLALITRPLVQHQVIAVGPSR